MHSSASGKPLVEQAAVPKPCLLFRQLALGVLDVEKRSLAGGGGPFGIHQQTGWFCLDYLYQFGSQWVLYELLACDSLGGSHGRQHVRRIGPRHLSIPRRGAMGN